MKPGSRMIAKITLLGAAAFSLIAGAAFADGGGAGAYDPVPGPSPWGPGDESGASNTQTPAKVLAAKKLIKTGQVYALGHVIAPDMTLSPNNSPYVIEAKPPLQAAQQHFNLDTLHGDLTQMGTQLDTLGHVGFIPPGSSDPDEVIYYNQRTGAEVHSDEGLAHLGVENVKPFVTRAVLLDVKRYANAGQTLYAGQEITLSMVAATLAAQKMTLDDIGSGDVVLFVTGWEENWPLGTVGYYVTPGLGMTEPGIGFEVAEWLASRGVACVGADNWGVEVVPSTPPAGSGLVFPVHHHLLAKNGIFIHESMALAALADVLAAEHLMASDEGKGRYEFFYVYSPLPIQGGSGSPGVPLAIR